MISGGPLTVGVLATSVAYTLLGIAQAPPSTMAVRDMELTLSIRVQAQIGATIRPLRDGDSLQTGDRLEFHIAVDRPGYAYVLQYLPDGSANVLYPERDDALLRGGYEVRIPEPGSWFEVTDPPGVERIYFVASIRPLGEADKRVAEAIRLIRSAESQPAEAKLAGQRLSGSSASSAAPPPLAFGLETRGRLIKVRPGNDVTSTSIRADGNGVAIYRFSIRHVPSR
jgi:hypothetical protein